jgi:glycosyltransferase involved in cell wall biosynthesis
MTRRRLLIIAFHYPPIQGSSGVHRSLAFSKYLPDFGWDVSVLTVTPGAHESIQADNHRMIPAHVHLVRAKAWDAARHFSIFGWYPSALTSPDRWSSWIPFGTRAGMRALRDEKHDAIFSTFPIASAHVLGQRLHQISGLPWIADFRDPMATATYPHEPWLRELWTRIQDSVLRLATRITVTTPGAASFYRRLNPAMAPRHVEVIENGFDPDAFPEAGAGLTRERSSPQALFLLHSGIVYPRERDPAPFFRALKRIMASGLIDRRSTRLRLRACGYEDLYQPMIEKLELRDVVDFSPALPYSEALQEMQSASALLLFQARNCNEQIPAKAYEYLYAGRPILGLTDPDGDTGRLLRRFGVSGIAALENEDDIVRMLEHALPRVLDGSYAVPARESLMAVSRREGTRQLATLLDEVIEERSIWGRTSAVPGRQLGAPRVKS